MHPVRRLAAILLLALWLPALLHCRLEAAGAMFEAGCCESPERAPETERCVEDACEVAEGEFTKPSSSPLVAPTLADNGEVQRWLASQVSLASVQRPREGVPEATAAPPEIARRWQFVVRAAPRPRAPASQS